MSKTPRDEECPGTSDSQRKEIAGHATTQPPYHKNDKNNNNTRPDNTQCEAVKENQVLEPRQSNERPLHSVFSPRIKVFVILMTVFNTIFSPFSSFIYLKAMTTIAKSYHRSPGEINLTVPSTKSCRPLHHCSLAISATRSADGPYMHPRLPSTWAQTSGWPCSTTTRRQWPCGLCKAQGEARQWQLAAPWLPTPNETILELKKLPLGIPVPGVVAAIRIIFEKDVGPLMLFMSLFATAYYAMLVPLRDVNRRRHSFSDVQAGLCYIPFAMGSVFGAVMVGRLLNWNYARVANGIGVSADRKRGDEVRRFPIERARLDHMWLWTMLAFVTTAIWGWVVNSGVSLAAPLVILFLAGKSLSGPISILTILLVGLYPMNAGRSSSSFNLTRAGISAAGTAVVQYIIDAWGYGFTYLFLALVGLAASPSILVVRRWGPRWREERYQRFGNVNV